MVKVFNNQGTWAYGSDLIAAIDQCAAAGAQIISMSLGGSGSSDAEEAAFAQAETDGILSIAAAGNGGSSSLSYPASYASVMSVAAIDSSQQVATFSQYNSQVEIAAPGVAVESTLPGNTYAAWNGTSMATPHVSGVAALVWGRHENQGCTATDIRNALTAGAQDLGGPGWDSSYGHGLVSATKSDSLLNSGCSVSPPPGVISTSLTNGTPDSASGARGDEHRFDIDVPNGASDLRFTISGGSGDADLYVRYSDPATSDLWDCRPYINGNSETCVEDAPNAGTWHAMLRGYADFANVNLTASYVDPGGGGTATNYFYPDADIPVVGYVTGTYANLDEGSSYQLITEVESGGKPNRRTSLAEHHWRIPNVTGGASVTLRVVAGLDDYGDGENFILDVSYNNGASWNEILTVPPGGYQTYSISLPATTNGTVMVRARDDDRTARNLGLERLWMDQLYIMTTADADETPPTAPTGLAAANDEANVELNWTDNSDNELGFKIRRWTMDGGGWGAMEDLGQTAENAEMWTDTGVMASTTYRYQVVAFTAGYESESGYSNSVTTPEPIGVSLTADGSKTKGRIFVTLEWTPAVDTDLTITRSVNGGASVPLPVDPPPVDCGAGSCTYVDATGLKGGPVIDYEVCAAGACDTATVTF